MILLRSMATVGGLTMVSRVFGFLRDILIANALGASWVADAFFVAFKFPNLFRRLFAEGAFTAAFVPIFAARLEADGKDSARTFAEQALSVLLAILLPFTLMLVLAMPLAMYVFAPGFVDEPAKFDLTVTLCRIVFPYLLFVSLVSLFAGVLNSYGRFAAAAAAPIILNGSMIVAVLLVAPPMPTVGHALAWGVAFAGVVQLAWLIAACGRVGMRLRLRRPRLTPDVRSLLRRAVPVAIGAGVYQVNLLIDTMIASLLPSGSVSYLFYADRVNQLPLGIVGVAVGTALLPLLARQVRAGNTEAALHNQNRALEFACLLTLPAATALATIADPIIVVLFQRGAFDVVQARATADALTAFSLGLPAFMLNKALTPAFFARHDTTTPVRIAVVTMIVNVVITLILMGPLLHVGIALASSIAAWLNAAALAIVLHRRGHLRLDDRLKRRLPRMLAASVLMGAVLLTLAPSAGGWIAGSFGHRVGALAVLVAAGAAVFLVASQILGAAAWQDVRILFRRPEAAP